MMLADLDWAKLVEQAPAAACMLAVVFLFIRYLGTLDKRGEAREATHAALVKEMGQACHEHQNQIMVRTEKMFTRIETVMGENAAATKDNTKALARAGH